MHISSAVVLSALVASASATSLPFNPRASKGVCSATAEACSSSGSSDSCCLPTNGHIVLSQQWLKGYCAGNPSGCKITPTNSWTIHGAWPDTCAGVNKENCSGPTYTNIATQVKNINPTLYASMVKTWVSYTGVDETFWEHEWSTHGRCWSPAAKTCFSSFKTGDDLQAYFSWVVALRNQFELGKAFTAGGITTGKTYTAKQIRAAITKTYPGLNVALICTNGYLSEVYSAVYATPSGGVAGAPISDSDSCSASGIKF
ncbi:ribonuclease T2-like [Thoreauomyces humboldtii]|nr:ribonuclease T2-like [Thoreauomyces humboldtii]